LKLNLILYYKGLAGVVNGGGELCRNGVVSSLVLEHETLVAVDALVDQWLFHLPVSNVCPLLLITLGVLLCVGCLPSRLPVVSELLEERCREVCGLENSVSRIDPEVFPNHKYQLTVKFGLVMLDAPASCARAIGARAALANRTEFLKCIMADV